MWANRYRFLFYLGRSRTVLELNFSGIFVNIFLSFSIMMIIMGAFCWGWKNNLHEEIVLLQVKTQRLLEQREQINVVLDQEFDLLKKIHKKVDPLYAVVRGREIVEDVPTHSNFNQEKFQQSNFLFEEMSVVQKKIALILNSIHNRADLLHRVPNGWPLPSSVPKRVGSGYGKRFSPFSKDFKLHTGVDLPAPPDTKIFCTGNGTVVFSGYKRSYGYTVMIEHGYGFSTLYAHCAQILVSEGEHVKKGQEIALVGISGDTTGFHLHYEVRIGQKAVDPQPFLMIDPSKEES